MKKKDLISAIDNLLRRTNTKKPISIPKRVFHISDDDGNHKDFIVRHTDKSVIYTADDINAILNACMEVIVDAIRRGESVYIHGFGELTLHKRAARRTVHPKTGEDVEVKERYVPKFLFGKDLRLAAKLYELSLSEKQTSDSLSDYEDNIDDTEVDT